MNKKFSKRYTNAMIDITKILADVTDNTIHEMLGLIAVIKAGIIYNMQRDIPIRKSEEEK